MATMTAGDVQVRRGTWWRVLLVGIVIYAVGIALLLATQNPNLFPTVIMVGNFAVPVAFVSFLNERRHLSRITMGTTVNGFLWGGLLGVLAASVLEPVIIHGNSVGSAYLVAVVEEAVKIIGVLIILRRKQHNSEMDGLILGAAAGMGFAALENMGYAFSAFIASSGSLSATVGITLMRGLLSPIGHGTWTALLVSAMARAASPAHFRVTGRVLLSYVTVVILHGLWNALPMATAGITGSGPLTLLPQLAVGAVGLLLLSRRWRDARRLQEQVQITGKPEAPVVG
jgi:RsiW-degrading membrane proteinase PrsW (M82 family)